MTTIRFIGDVHGKYGPYKKLIKNVKNTIQVGDFGVGFFKWDYHENCRVPLINPPYDSIIKDNHRFIRGNHDNLSVCKKKSYWIQDGTIELIDGNKIMYIGGALSVDKIYRKEGYDWWDDEELSNNELTLLVDKYIIEKPDIVVTHDCPEEIAIMMDEWSGHKKLDISSRTRQALQSMFEIHKPKLHIFGHWHFPIDKVYKNTHFICLNELQYIDIVFKDSRFTSLK